MTSAEKLRAPRLPSGGRWHRCPLPRKCQNSRLPEECRRSAHTTLFAQLGHSRPPLSFKVAGAFRSPSSPTTPAKGRPREEAGRVASHLNIKCVPSFATRPHLPGSSGDPSQSQGRGGLGPALISLTRAPPGVWELTCPLSAASGPEPPSALAGPLPAAPVPAGGRQGPAGPGACARLFLSLLLLLTAPLDTSQFVFPSLSF